MRHSVPAGVVATFFLSGCLALNKPTPAARRVYGVSIGPKSGGLIPETSDFTSPQWGVGVSPPIQVYEFHAPPKEGQIPASCYNPPQLLRDLESLILNDPGNCRSVSQTTDPDGMSGLYIGCTVRKPLGDCSDVYSATLWPEQDDHATPGEHYVIRAFAWVRRACATTNGSATSLPDYPTVHDLFGSKSNSIAAFFQRCGGVGPALSDAGAGPVLDGAVP
jgi:hypothetical protein